MKAFNLEYRPSQIFGPQDLKSFYKSRILGQLRAELISDNVEKVSIPDTLKKSAIEPNFRRMQEQIHPWMMGGEYLPDLLTDEIELCRVVLKSTTMDVTSLRIRKQKRRYTYRVVDEYSNKFKISPKTSTRPITMREVIQIIDQCFIFDENDDELEFQGLVEPQIIHLKDYGYSKEETLDFVTVESQFYPELHDYYEYQKSLWFDNLP